MKRVASCACLFGDESAGPTGLRVVGEGQWSPVGGRLHMEEKPKQTRSTIGSGRTNGFQVSGMSRVDVGVVWRGRGQ